MIENWINEAPLSRAVAPASAGRSQNALREAR